MHLEFLSKNRLQRLQIKRNKLSKQ